MAFEPKKFSDIYEDMRDRMEDVLTDFEVGSVARTMFESFAYELGTLYQSMNLVYLSGFVDTAEGQHLDRVVSVLGIQRGLPDYAAGTVTFTRDRSNFDITIPIGTLVATEEREDVPKKVYATIDHLVFPQNVSTIDAVVQAVERGDKLDTDAQTIVVMPRPLVGMKSVTNFERVKLSGRRLETDEELRRRAKNALLSSGKADKSAIENAVLALPGILSVAVVEHFDQKRYGMIDVIIDSPDFERVKPSVIAAIDKVRAAGIYVKVKPSDELEVGGTIFITPIQLPLSKEAEAALSQQVQQEFSNFLRRLHLGQPLLLTKVIQKLLSIDDVGDVLLKLSVKGQPLTHRTEAATTERFILGADFKVVINSI